MEIRDSGERSGNGCGGRINAIMAIHLSDSHLAGTRDGMGACLRTPRPIRAGVGDVRICRQSPGLGRRNRRHGSGIGGGGRRRGEERADSRGRGHGWAVAAGYGRGDAGHRRRILRVRPSPRRYVDKFELRRCGVYVRHGLTFGPAIAAESGQIRGASGKQAGILARAYAYTTVLRSRTRRNGRQLRTHRWVRTTGRRGPKFVAASGHKRPRTSYAGADSDSTSDIHG